MGKILYDIKKYDKAILCYDKVLEKDGESLDALINKGHALFHLKRYSESYLYYDKALKITTSYSLL